MNKQRPIYECALEENFRRGSNYDKVKKFKKNHLPILSNEMKEEIRKEKRMRLLLDRDVQYIILVYDVDPEDPTFHNLKVMMNNLIDKLRKDNLTYFVKFYSHLDLFQGIDCYNNKDSKETVLGGIYSRGNVYLIENNKIDKESKGSFIRSLKGRYFKLEENITLIEDNNYYSVFEYINPVDDLENIEEEV
jgi:GTPase SAR1 family protein